MGCHSNSTQQDSPVEGESPRTVSPRKETRQQTRVLAKDTLNVLQEEVIRKTARGGEADFASFFRKWAQSIQRENPREFNGYIDPTRGLYLIEAPGAVPHFTHVTDISTFRRMGAQPGMFFTIRETFQECRLEEVQVLPTLTCGGENNNFSREGCFVAEATAFRKSDAYQYAGLPPDEQKKIAQTQLLVSRTVLHTGSGFKFHFGQIKGQWRVLFIDLTVPCSA